GSQGAPPPTVAVRASGSMLTWSRSLVTTRTLCSSAGTVTPWPVLCTATENPWVAAYRTACTTSASDAARTTTAGRWVQARFHPAQVSAYNASAGCSTAPSQEATSCSIPLGGGCSLTV